MLTKERYMSLLDDIAKYAYDANIGPNGINEINEDYNELKELIEEHFTPQSLEFNDLKENMWVYDKAFKVCRQVHKLYNNGERNIIQFKSNHYPELAEAYFFEENRFYPIIIPNTGDKNG